MATKNRIELDNAVIRLNGLIEKTGRKIIIEGRNNYICLDLGSIEFDNVLNMIDSYKTEKLALKGVYSMIEIAKILK